MTSVWIVVVVISLVGAGFISFLTGLTYIQALVVELVVVLCGAIGIAFFKRPA